MEVKPGFKRSEIGMVPDDWDVVPLDRLCHTICDGTHFTPRYVAEGVPFYSVENITRDDFVNTKYISVAEHKILIKRCRPEKGDILMTRITAGVLGDTKMIDWEVDASIYVSLALLKPNDRVCPEYLYRYTKSKEFRNDVEKRALMNATPKKINMNSIGAIPIPVPRSLNEQRAIAGALSNANALIESLEQLIAKKRQIKLGAMQELLTGKRRLPGFSGKWETRKLNDVGGWRGGMTPSMREPLYWQGGTVPWISSGDVKSVRLSSTGAALTEYAIRSGATTLLPPNSIVVVTRSGILRKYLPVAINIVPMAINQDIKAIVPHDHISSDYLLHSLVAHGDQILAQCLKAGTTVESVEFAWLKAFAIPIPPSEEQRAIAAVLSDMDAEIAALEEKLAKARNVKQGMMQELLTGRIRLV